MGQFRRFFEQKIALPANDYRVFTRRFDRVVLAGQLDSVIGSPTSESKQALDIAWKEYQDGLSGWRAKATIKLLDLVEGLRGGLSEEKRKETLFTILLDQSGSMRGPKMLMTAMVADILQASLVGIGIGCEVLGFTTVRWRGGRSRSMWRLMGRPRNPGRLCDLLHIIYKDAADTRASTDGWQFRQMLRPDLPKENIDGEAIEWAVSRLRAHPSADKILLVISDGAPVDDSTIMANNLEYLPGHLKSVLRDIESLGDLKVCALGLAHDVEQYYAISERVEVPGDLPAAIVSLCERVFLQG